MSLGFVMFFIPVPFLVGILLIVLCVAIARREGDGAANPPFLALILVSAFLCFLSGLRWGYGVRDFMFLSPLAAAAVPPLAYMGVARLVRGSRVSANMRIALHALPTLIVLALMMVWQEAIDLVLVLISVGYAVAILLLMRPGADALRLTPFESAAPTYRAILFAASALFLSAAVDTFITLDLAWTQGRHVRPVIALGNLASLFVLSVAAAAASRSHAPTQVETSAPASAPAFTDDIETMAAVQVLMQEKRVYRDVDLNLNRLARKAGIPARQISTAINRATGKNVSQYVNEYRIAEACGLLLETDKSVTEIMFEVGFQTKSNFNREFRRVTEMTPLEWRERNAAQSSIAI